MGDRQQPFISVVVPACNEEGNVPRLGQALAGVLAPWPRHEIIFVDDGSTDKTLARIQQLRERDGRIKYLSFSRNFGHQYALKAGIDHARGDCVITLDCDLQHPPALIPELIRRWQEGYEVVLTVRNENANFSFFKKKTANCYYRLLNLLSDIPVAPRTADFRLMDRAVAEVFRRMNETALFIRGIVAWLGFRQCLVHYDPAPRTSGRTHYTFSRMLGFAINGIISFSIKPLRLAIFLGTGFSLLGFLYALYAAGLKIFTTAPVPGWTSILVCVLLLGGIQLMVLGIIGEYIGKLFMESKKRPIYIIRESGGWTGESGPALPPGQEPPPEQGGPGQQ